MENGKWKMKTDSNFFLLKSCWSWCVCAIDTAESFIFFILKIHLHNQHQILYIFFSYLKHLNNRYFLNTHTHTYTWRCDHNIMRYNRPRNLLFVVAVVVVVVVIQNIIIIINLLLFWNKKVRERERKEEN